MTDKEKDLIEEDYLDDQPLSEEEKALLDTIYDRLDMFEQMNRPYHEDAKDCRQILHMEDPYQDDPETLEGNGKPTLQLQSLKATINNTVADQMLSMPEAKLLPETLELQEEADDLQDMVHHVMYITNNFENIQYDRGEDFYSTGTAITQIAWDQDMQYGKGDIALIRWPVEAFLWDYTVDNIQDARAVMKVSWHPLSFYKSHWPEEGKYVGADDNSHNNVGKTQDSDDHQNDEPKALLVEYWWREYNASTRRYSINVAYAAGNALLEVHKDVYAHGRYPFVLDIHDKIEGSMVGEGLVKQLAPMMRYINRYAAYADMNARMSSKARLLISEQAGVDMEAISDWKRDIITSQQRVDPTALQWLQSPPFNSTIVQLMTMLQSDLKADSGANQFTRGETTGGIVSGKAINSLIQAGGKIASMRTEQLKYGCKEMVEQIIWLMAQFYDNDRVMMITGRKGRRNIKINAKKMFGRELKGAVQPPPYTVQIEISSRDPQRIASQNQMFMEAFTMAAQTDNPMKLSDLFRILNLDGKDKILPIIEANEHYQEMMMQLQQQLEQMGAQMEQLQADNANLKKAGNQMANTLSNVSTRRNDQRPVQKEGGTNSSDMPNAIVDQARNMMGVQTGSELPT